jgi:hypothetical protein
MYVAASCMAQDATTASATAREWDVYLNTIGFLIPGGGSYGSPNLQASRGRLHLEARYNWEDLETGSFFAGRKFSLDKALSIDVTPMAGVVLGKTTGVAPGLLLDISYKRLAIESQSEYVFATNVVQDFYNVWTETTYEFVDWFRAGAVVQRNKAFRTKVENQYGLIVNFSYRRADLTVYGFDLGRGNPSAALALGIRF